MLPATIDTHNGLSEAANGFAAEAKRPNTRRAYRAGWADFEAFCQARGLTSLPAAPATVADYLAYLAEAGQGVRTLGVKRAAVAFAHGLAHQANPTTAAEVKQVMSGIVSKLGKPPVKKAPITRALLRRMVRAQPKGIVGTRNKALLLLGWAGAFRRSELVALDVGDVHFVDDGLKVLVRHSKTDKEAKGQYKFCPSKGVAKGLDAAPALRAWLKAAGVKSGPLLRPVDKWGHVRARGLTGRSVANIVHASLLAAGLDAAQAAQFGAHSLRSGFITAASLAGAQEWQIGEQSGHTDMRTLRGYIQTSGRGAAAAVRAALGGEG